MINLWRIFDEHPDVWVSLDFGNDYVTFVAKFGKKKGSLSFSYTQLSQIRDPEMIEQEIIKLCESVRTTAIREGLIEEAQKCKGTIFEKWLLKQAENAGRVDPYTIERDIQIIWDIIDGKISEGSETYNRVMKDVEADLERSG